MTSRFLHKGPTLMTRRDLTFRIFVSSTFSDFIRERNALQRVVFPRLREYCRQSGAKFPGMEPRFQAIDLRWGVAREAALDQQTMDICIQELQRCQELSPRPNFIVLMGNRYGWIPLPAQIQTDEFEELVQHFSTEEREFIQGTVDLRKWQDGRRNDRRGWYRRDENAVPAEFVLQPRAIEFPADVDNDDRKRIQREEFADWTSVENRIAAALTAATRKADWPDNDPRRHKYERSATHQEIEHGALSTTDAEQHVFCYFRKIDGLPDDATAKGFRDFNADGTLDATATACLDWLANQLDPAEAGPDSAIPAKHRFHYAVPWQTLHGQKDTGVIDVDAEWQPSPDLSEFCSRVETDLKVIIDHELESFQQETETQRETRLHSEFTAQHTERFVGREDMLQQIESWCIGDNSQPLIIAGVSGSGKTALMAKATERMQVTRPDALIIRRFIGATPGSTEVRTLLSGLCIELGEGELPAEVSQLSREFEKRLEAAAATRPVLVFIDALDQLSAAENAHSLWWFPRKLPTGTKLIATVLDREDESGGCHRAAGRMFPDSVVSLSGMSDDEGRQLLNEWLAGASRKLQPHQETIVLNGFRSSPWPLYLRTAFHEAKRWRSWETPSPLANDISELLQNLFQRLSEPEYHGRLLVSRSLGYLAAARRGLTEDELLDVLSQEPDRAVLEEFRERSPDSPETDRLPMVIWSRLFADLKENLAQRQAFGAAVLSFYHRQVLEAAQREFLEGSDRIRAHENLAKYFHAQNYWRESLEEQRERARRLPPTPRPANIRKVDELPYHVLELAKLAGGDDAESPYWDAVADLFTDWQFLEAKAEAQPFADAKTETQATT